MEGNRGEPETIDVGELMKGLDDDDEKSPRAMQFPKLSLPKQKTASAMASAKLPVDSFTLEPSDVDEIPQWLSSFHMRSGLGRSTAGPSDGLIGDSSVHATARSRVGSAGGSSTHASDLFGDKLSVLPHDTLAEHLQRSLSFEASPKNEREGRFGQKDDAFDARQDKGPKMADTSGFSSSWLLSEGESALSFSSPSFSAAVNIKKWFRDDSRASKKQQANSKAASKVFGSDSQLPPQKASPPVLHATTKSSTGASMKGASAGSLNPWGQANHDGGNMHPVPTNRDAAGGYPTPSSVSQSRTAGGRRHRHSFTSGNRQPQFTEDRNPPPFVNRPSSWELEKVGVDPKLKVVFYSTSSQTDVHAYEDCNAVRAILISVVGAGFDEKSISQHPQYEQELKSALNTPTALVPTVYVRGRYIAGVDNIMQLYKKGVLGSLLLETLAHGFLTKPNAPCICRGGKFLICPVCKGKRSLSRQSGDDAVLCRHCSGTGLIKCPSCLNS